MSNSTEAYAANCFLPLNFWSLIVCFDRNFDAKSGGIINFPVSLFSEMKVQQQEQARCTQSVSCLQKCARPSIHLTRIKKSMNYSIS